MSNLPGQPISNTLHTEGVELPHLQDGEVLSSSGDTDTTYNVPGNPHAITTKPPEPAGFPVNPNLPGEPMMSPSGVIDFGYGAVIMGEGFIYVGHLLIYPTGIVVIRDALNLRSFASSSNGLGGCMIKGPDASTNTNPVGFPVVSLRSAFKHFISTDPDLWTARRDVKTA